MYLALGDALFQQFVQLELTRLLGIGDYAENNGGSSHLSSGHLFRQSSSLFIVISFKEQGSQLRVRSIVRWLRVTAATSSERERCRTVSMRQCDSGSNARPGLYKPINMIGGLWQRTCLNCLTV